MTARKARAVGLLAGVLLLLLCGAAVAQEVLPLPALPVLARHALDGGHVMTVYEDPAVGVLCYVFDRGAAMSCVPISATNYVSEIAE